jgi:hypothetical protein
VNAFTVDKRDELVSVQFTFLSSVGIMNFDTLLPPPDISILETTPTMLEDTIDLLLISWLMIINQKIRPVRSLHGVQIIRFCCSIVEFEVSIANDYEECYLLGYGTMWVYYKPMFLKEHVTSIFLVEDIMRGRKVTVSLLFNIKHFSSLMLFLLP